MQTQPLDPPRGYLSPQREALGELPHAAEGALLLAAAESAEDGGGREDDEEEEAQAVDEDLQVGGRGQRGGRRV